MSQTEVQLIKDAVIVDADINSSAAIALSKIATGALPSGITVASANLVDGTIVNADINASAAIDVSKISGAMPLAGGSFTDDVTFTGASANIVFDKSDNQLEFADNAKAEFGTGGDLEIFHNGSQSKIIDTQGNELRLNADTIRFRDKDDGDTYANFIHDGAVELYHDNSKQFETLTNGVKPTNNLFMNDNKVIYVGAGLDLQIYHDSNHSRIVDSGTGGLKIQSDALAIDNAAGTETMAAFTQDGSVQLRHNNSTKFETTSTGATVTGVCTATSFSGSGANLTDVDAGATGGGSDKIFYENGQTVTQNYTIGDTFGAACNAMAAGPITINSNVTVTVNSGETLTIV